MKKRLQCAAAFLAASLGVPATGQASIFELHFNAVVTHVGDLTGTLDTLVQVGDHVNIDIGYDPDTPEHPGYVNDPTQGAYLSTGWIHITVNDLFFAIDGVQVDVVNRPDQDLFSVNAGTLYPNSVISQWPAALPLFPIRGGGVGFIDITAPFNLVSNDALPEAPLRWDRADIASGHIGAGTDELSMYDISFQVPEPTMIALAGFGIAWTMGRRRRIR
jgi:hypothetical protein